MENLFLRIFRGSGVKPTTNAEKAFSGRFPDALNPEWFEKKDGYEVIFYLEGREAIVQLDKDGKWTETRINLDPGQFEGPAGKRSREYGEIMNAIHIETAGSSRFEVIYRDNHLNRFLLLLSDDGNVIQHSSL